MHIRKANNQDGPAVCAVVATVLEEYGLRFEADGKDTDLQDLEQNYLSNSGDFLVLLDAEKIVGCGGIYRLDASTCELQKMYLLPRARGCGQGLQLLEELLDSAKAKGYRTVRLETNQVLKEAIRLYQKYGFRPIPLEGGPTARIDQAWELQLEHS